MDNKTTTMESNNYGGQFVITGTLVNDKRFRPIYTKTPQHYNIWKGTIWKVDKTTGKRKRFQQINN
jgi:hypothetical protein